ncbi:hypothetical protein HPB49_016597 [Dermacentor silvarum]|uniref:Uncharacterized protein n=1 Tax=Dermacentor silvarum TaxID=543639 RepID=A0ACB8CLY0_DERSI|nr:hypothetical protein HPB49_016597 [Dermacentor silvarum]
MAIGAHRRVPGCESLYLGRVTVSLALNQYDLRLKPTFTEGCTSVGSSLRSWDLNQMQDDAEFQHFSCERTGGGYHTDVASGCLSYHYCEKMENGNWRQRHFVCPQGTTFDDTTGECGSRNVSCNQTDSAVTELEAPEQVTAAASVPTTPSPRDVEQSVTRVPELVVERRNTSADSKNESTSHAMCPANFGYFPHIESECRKYYACVRLGQGTVVKHVFDCPRAKRFDSANMLCVEANKAPKCQFAATAEYKDVAYDEQELLNMTSLPSKNDYGLVGLLPVNLTVEALDRMMARIIMSYVQSGKNITEGELTAVQKRLSETEPVPLTVLATIKLVSTGLRRLPNASEVMDMLSIMYDEHEKFLGSGFLERSRSVVRNLTSLVERYGAIRALSAATSYKRLKNAYETVRSNWFVLRNRTAPLFYGNEDNAANAEPAYFITTTPAPTEAYLGQPPSHQDFVDHKQSADLSHQSVATHTGIRTGTSATALGSSEGTNSPVVILRQPSAHSSFQQSMEYSVPSSTGDRIKHVGSEGVPQEHKEQSLSPEDSSGRTGEPVKQAVHANTDDEYYDGLGASHSEDKSQNEDPNWFVDNYDYYDAFRGSEDSYLVPDLGGQLDDQALVVHAEDNYQ